MRRRSTANTRDVARQDAQFDRRNGIVSPRHMPPACAIAQSQDVSSGSSRAVGE
jgi:hypothetical protein